MCEDNTVGFLAFVGMTRMPDTIFLSISAKVQIAVGREADEFESLPRSDQQISCIRKFDLHRVLPTVATSLFYKSQRIFVRRLERLPTVLDGVLISDSASCNSFRASEVVCRPARRANPDRVPFVRHSFTGVESFELRSPLIEPRVNCFATVWL